MFLFGSFEFKITKFYILKFYRSYICVASSVILDTCCKYQVRLASKLMKYNEYIRIIWKVI